MFVIDPHSILLVVPQNVVTAVGLPLAAGFYIGSYTKEVVRGRWYNVCRLRHIRLCANELTRRRASNSRLADLMDVSFP